MVLSTLTGLLRQALAQVAQIYFQSSAWTGLVVLIALAVVQPWAAAGMSLASVVAVAVSRLARLDRAAGEAGLLGYNAALTGAGLLSLFTPTVASVAAVTLVGGVTPLITARWLRWGRLPPLTLQFVVFTWAALWFGDVLGPQLAPPGCPAGPAIVPCGVGQVTFIAGALPGLCVWAAIVGHAPFAGLWLGLGAALGGLGGLLLGAEAHAVGLAVNAGLTAQGLAVSGRQPVLRLLGVALAAALCLLGARFAVPVFTLPFVLATWTVLQIPARAAQLAGVVREPAHRPAARGRPPPSS